METLCAGEFTRLHDISPLWGNICRGQESKQRLILRKGHVELMQISLKVYLWFNRVIDEQTMAGEHGRRIISLANRTKVQFVPSNITKLLHTYVYGSRLWNGEVPRDLIRLVNYQISDMRYYRWSINVDFLSTYETPVQFKVPWADNLTIEFFSTLWC